MPARPAIGMMTIVTEASYANPGVRSAYRQLLATLPRAPREALRPYPEYAWSLLRLVFRQPSALELVASTPALAFAIANASRVGHLRDDEAAARAPAMVHKRRAEILDWLGLPNTKSAVRIYAKVTATAATVAGLRDLRRLLTSDADDALKLVRHQPVLNAEVLALLMNPKLQRRVTPQFLEELGEVRSSGTYIVDRINYTLRDYPIVYGDRRPPRLRSLEQFRALSADVGRRMLERRLAEAGPFRELLPSSVNELPAGETWDTMVAPNPDDWRSAAGDSASSSRTRWSFPKPPLPGNANIVPLTSVSALFDESVSQRNCVNGYVGRVRSRQTYIYRVLRPERCTLSLVPDGRGWSIGELYRSCNRSPSPKTVQTVRQWLRAANTWARATAVGC